MYNIDALLNTAKLRITQSEKESFLTYIKDNLKDVEILKELNIDENDLEYNVEDKACILRNDEIKPSLNKEDVLNNALNTKDGYFMIPNNLK